MKKDGLKDRILKYFKNHPNEWIASASIEKLTQQHTKHIASYASRCCRYLFEEGQLMREMRYSGQSGHKKIAWYRYEKEQTPEMLVKKQVEWFETL